MTASIRPARLADAEAIADLTRQLGYDTDTEALTGRLSRLLERDGHRLLVAESGGRVVGWIHACVAEYLELEEFLVIAGLVVDRNRRGEGIGRLLLAHAEGWGRERGCAIVRLWSTETRTDAHRLYERLGYTHVKTQKSFARRLDGGSSATLQALVPRVEKP